MKGGAITHRWHSRGKPPGVGAAGGKSRGWEAVQGEERSEEETCREMKLGVTENSALTHTALNL